MSWRGILAGLLLLGVVSVQAHEVTIEWQVADGTLELRGIVGTEPAAGAAVEVRSARGRVLASGKMDGAGRYRWSVVERGPVTVVMSDGLGHRRTMTLTDSELRGGSGGGEGRDEAALSRTMRVGLGLTFLLAMAAAWMSYRNMRQLAVIQRRLHRDESRS